MADEGKSNCLCRISRVKYGFVNFFSLLNMKIRYSLVAVACAVVGSISLSGCNTAPMVAAAPTQQVFFVSPKNGDTVAATFKVKFGVSNLTVKPALEDIENKNAGHHHLLINLDPIKEGEGVPFTEQHIHFGKGQTEADVTLKPGTYKLTMQFANGAHVSYGQRLSQTITVTVK
jgi:hypothetical protein